MLLNLSQMLALATQCAPTVAPETLLAVAKVESGFNALAIGVNGLPRRRVAATTPSEAAASARRLIAAGRSVDLGVAQINSGNLDWLGLSVEAAFEPCRNLRAAAVVLADGYRRGSRRASEPQAALRTALSYYNTGDPRRGFRNGYVAKVDRAAAEIVPALRPAAPAPAKRPAPELAASAAAAPPAGERPRWDVFGELTPAAVPASGQTSEAPDPAGDHP